MNASMKDCTDGSADGKSVDSSRLSFVLMSSTKILKPDISKWLKMNNGKPKLSNGLKR